MEWADYSIAKPKTQTEERILAVFNTFAYDTPVNAADLCHNIAEAIDEIVRAEVKRQLDEQKSGNILRRYLPW